MWWWSGTGGTTPHQKLTELHTLVSRQLCGASVRRGHVLVYALVDTLANPWCLVSQAEFAAEDTPADVGKLVTVFQGAASMIRSRYHVSLKQMLEAPFTAW